MNDVRRRASRGTHRCYPPFSIGEVDEYMSDIVNKIEQLAGYLEQENIKNQELRDKLAKAEADKSELEEKCLELEFANEELVNEVTELRQKQAFVNSRIDAILEHLDLHSAEAAGEDEHEGTADAGEIKT